MHRFLDTFCQLFKGHLCLINMRNGFKSSFTFFSVMDECKFIPALDMLCCSKLPRLNWKILQSHALAHFSVVFFRTTLFLDTVVIVEKSEPLSWKDHLRLEETVTHLLGQVKQHVWAHFVISPLRITAKTLKVSFAGDRHQPPSGLVLGLWWLCDPDTHRVHHQDSCGDNG